MGLLPSSFLLYSLPAGFTGIGVLMDGVFRLVRGFLLLVLVGLFGLIFGWGFFYVLQFVRSLVGGV